MAPGSGNEHWEETDYRSGDNRLTFGRSYNSANAVATTFSPGWQSNVLGRRIIPLTSALPYRLAVFPDPASACSGGSSGATYLGNMQCQLSNGTVVPVYNSSMSSPWTLYNGYTGYGLNGYSGLAIQRQDGSLIFFGCSSSACTANPDVSVRLTPVYYNSNVNSYYSYTLTDNNDTVEQYDGAGKLRIVTARNGYQQTFSYSNGQLSSISDSLGRSLSFSYNAQGQLQTLTTPDGNIQYGYDGSRRLATVTYPDGSVRTYQYADTSHPNALTGVIDENNSAYVSTSYDAQGRAYQSGLAGGVGFSSINYSDPANPVVTDAFGVARTYHYVTINGWQKISSISGAASCLTCNADAATSYDSAGYPQSSTDWNGNVTNYAYDDSRGLETSRTEAYGTPQQRTISTTWHTTFRLPTEIDEPGRKTTFTYDASGNLLTRTITDTATNASRTWTYSNYTAWGTPQTIQGPRTDLAQVSQLAYYPIVSGDSKSGQVKTITDALNHVTTFNAYDASSRPTQITDPNGVVTMLAYSPRGWITSRKFGGALTQFGYDKVGSLVKLTLPDNSYLKFGYDAAHRLTDVTDSFGNTIHYTVDAMGNRTRTDVRDPNGVLVRTQQAIYDSLDRLQQVIGAQSGETTNYAYDNNGNLHSVTDALNHLTVRAYDALNRLIQVTDPANGITQYGYDALDHLTSVSDANNHITSYQYDAFGDLLSQTSPDSGVTTYSYDSAGNPLSETDARGVIVQYSHDALNRLTGKTYSNANYNQTFAYDGSNYTSTTPNGIGRLTGTTSNGGATERLVYDAHGNLTQYASVIVGLERDSSYQYDAADRIGQITYPTGRIVKYSRDGMGRITQVDMQVPGASSSTTTLASGITYLPFGPATGWTLGNGITVSRQYDQDYRAHQLTDSGVLDWTYAYDARSLVTGITDNLTSSRSQTLGYDGLGRLSSASGAYGALSYSYDPVGNRLTETRNGTATRYLYDPASNRLSSLSGGTKESFGYDAAGHATQRGGTTLSYDPAGRVSNTGAQSYITYTPGGQRWVQYHGGTSDRYDYDQAGHLLDERSYACASTCASWTEGTIQREYVYLGDIPLAVVARRTPTFNTTLSGLLGTGGVVPVSDPSVETFYAHSDQLGMVQKLSDANKQVVWDAQYEPFGNVSFPNTQLVTNPLRFPGQYYDSETGLHQNWFRDYDPGVGRYIQSDPIGLGGGVNTYAYVDGNPLNFYDPDGLAKSGGVQPVPGTNNSVAVHQPHVPNTNQQVHAHIFDKNGNQIFILNKDGTPSHGYCPEKLPKTKKLLKFLRNLDFNVPLEFDLLYFVDPYGLLNTCNDPQCIIQSMDFGS